MKKPLPNRFIFSHFTGMHPVFRDILGGPDRKMLPFLQIIFARNFIAHIFGGDETNTEVFSPFFFLIATTSGNARSRSTPNL